MPTVWPSRSWPMKMLRSKISRRIARSASTMRLERLSIMASACSATASLLPPAWLRQSTPASVQAFRLTVS